MGDIVVSFSELKQYQSCPRSWQLGYLERWRGEEALGAATLGKLLHAALEELYNPQWSPKTRLGMARATVQDSEDPRQADAERILEGYIEWAREEDASAGWEPLAVEWKFEVPLPLRGFKLKGSVDLIVKNRAGQILIVDHKSSSMAYPRDLAWWPQGLGYVYAWNLMFPETPANAVVWNGLSTKPAPVRSTTAWEPFKRVYGFVNPQDALSCATNFAEEARNAYENYGNERFDLVEFDDDWLGRQIVVSEPSAPRRAPIRPSTLGCRFCPFSLTCEQDRRTPLTDDQWHERLVEQGFTPNAPRT